MTYDQFEKICKREWDNGFGDVTEIHLDAAAYNELWPTVDTVTSFPSLSILVNPITRTAAKIIVHKNHLIVKRPPLPPATTHTVML